MKELVLLLTTEQLRRGSAESDLTARDAELAALRQHLTARDAQAIGLHAELAARHAHIASLQNDLAAKTREVSTAGHGRVYCAFSSVNQIGQLRNSHTKNGCSSVGMTQQK
jgi:hypothetical protein